MPRSRAVLRALGLLSQVMMSLVTLAWRMASAMDAPINPIPMNATRLNNCFGALGTFSTHERGQSVEGDFHFFLGAQRDAQVVGQTIAIDAPGENALRLQEGVGFGNRAGGKLGQHEV